MLGFGKTVGDSPLRPRWWAFLFGGNYNQVGRDLQTGKLRYSGCGYGWTPPLWRLIYRYYKEGWHKHGTGFWRFIGIRRMFPDLLFPRETNLQKWKISWCRPYATYSVGKVSEWPKETDC